MKMKWIGGFILLALFSGASLRAQEAQKPLTLEESIKTALDRSLQLHSAVEGVMGSQFRQKEAFTNFLPTWTGQYSFTRFNPNSPAVIGSGSNRDVANLSTTVNQPVFTGGANLANYRSQTYGVDISKMNVDVVKRDVILQVKTGYFTILKSLKLRDVAEQNVKLFEAQLEVSRAFFEVGIVAKNDVLLAEVNVANAVQGLVKAENDLAVAKSSFNTFLRRGVETPLTVVDILEYKPFPLTFEDSAGEALRLRQEIKSAELSISQAKEAVKVARAGFFPTVSLSGNYNRLSDEVGLNGELRTERWSVQALATITLWNWGNTAYKVGENKVLVKQAEDGKTQIIEGIILEVKQDYLNMLTAERNIKVAEKAIEQSEENLRMNEERYKYQVAAAIDVQNAVTLLTQARSNYYNALSDFNIAKAQLERSMGRMYP